MLINPCEDMNRWEVCCTTQLADAQLYYTKAEVDELISTSGEGVTRSEVQEMIDENVNPIVEEVQRQAQAILNCYTKNEVNQLLEGYAKVENNTLIINEN